MLDGTTVSHSGTGEYQLLDLPDNDLAVHYYGCPVNIDTGNAANYGTYTGALAIQIGSAKIEILGNKLTANGIACVAARSRTGARPPPVLTHARTHMHAPRNALLRRSAYCGLACPRACLSSAGQVHHQLRR